MYPLAFTFFSLQHLNVSCVRHCIVSSCMRRFAQNQTSSLLACKRTHRLSLQRRLFLHDFLAVFWYAHCFRAFYIAHWFSLHLFWYCQVDICQGKLFLKCSFQVWCRLQQQQQHKHRLLSASRIAHSSTCKSSACMARLHIHALCIFSDTTYFTLEDIVHTSAAHEDLTAVCLQECRQQQF